MNHTVCNHTQVLDGTVPFIVVLLYTTRIGWNSQSGWLSPQLSNAFVTLGGACFPEEKLFSQGGVPYFSVISQRLVYELNYSIAILAILAVISQFFSP